MECGSGCDSRLAICAGLCIMVIVMKVVSMDIYMMII